MKATDTKRPSARKSFGQYKAVIVHEDGRSEILGKVSRPLVWRGKESMPGGPMRFVRGKTFASREEAIAFARRTIDLRAQRHAEYMASYNSRHAQRTGETA